MKNVNPAGLYPYPSLTIDRALLVTIEKNLRAHGCRYGLGDKAPSMTCDTSQIPSIDCSGFVRYALCRASGADIGDGSVQQHDNVVAAGFKRSTVLDAHNHDNAVRIAFLSPSDGGGVGHVMLVLNEQTLESHGGLGPDRRVWDTTAHPFMALCSVFVLAPPT